MNRKNDLEKKQNLPNGARVTLTPEGALQYRTLAGHSGTIIGRSDYPLSVRVKWDHQTTPKTMRADLLKKE
jgi:hypothetical protein